MEKLEFNFLGKEFPRKDGYARVTGKEKYASDIILPEMMHARVVASPHAHARVIRVDTSEAEAMGAICLTFDDIPKVRYNERLVTVPWALHKDNYVIVDKVRRMGEAVAAVAADTEELAQKAINAIKVEYEVLPAVVDPEKAMLDGAPAVYDKVMYGDQEIEIKNNIATTREVYEGDIEKGFAEADVIVEGRFRTPKLYHAQMEPKSVVVRPEADGGLTVWPATQTIHNTRILLGQIFGIPLSKINVKKVPVGGTFGSGIQTNTPIPICTALALKAGKPVRLSLTREEDMNDHSRYPSIIDLKIGAKKDGTLTAAKMDLIADIGAHIIQSYSYLGVTIGWLVSLYKFPNVAYQGKAVYTNKSPSCAMQGFGNPQVAFATESLIDELAEKLGMDPLELTLKNYIGLGDTFWGQGPLVRSIVLSDGVPQLIKKGADLIGWERRQKAGTQSGRYVTGIGHGRSFHTSGAGAPQPGDVIDYSGAMVKINEDGSVDIVSALMDHGGGTLEAMAKLVAETLCVPLDKVNLAPAETCSTVYDVVTHATRGVYVGCGAAVKVAEQVKAELFDTAARFMNVMPESLSLKLDEELGQGVVFVPSIPDKKMTIGEIATKCWATSWKTIASVDSYRAVNCPPAYVSVFLEIEVDTWTGIITTKKAVVGSDCGTLVNPEMGRGQLEGGLSRGAGYALYEQNDWDENGHLTSGGHWIDAKTPGVMESPKIEELVTFFSDTFEPSGPHGAKGIGEAALNPVAAAYGNAVYNATGIRFYEIPITPEKLLKALKERK
jgi:xanthine dehydrogenase molybdenum-binding subunit